MFIILGVSIVQDAAFANFKMFINEDYYNVTLHYEYANLLRLIVRFEIRKP